MYIDKKTTQTPDGRIWSVVTEPYELGHPERYFKNGVIRVFVSDGADQGEREIPLRLSLVSHLINWNNEFTWPPEEVREVFADGNSVVIRYWDPLDLFGEMLRTEAEWTATLEPWTGRWHLKRVRWLDYDGADNTSGLYQSELANNLVYGELSNQTPDLPSLDTEPNQKASFASFGVACLRFLLPAVVMACDDPWLKPRQKVLSIAGHLMGLIAVLVSGSLSGRVEANTYRESLGTNTWDCIGLIGLAWETGLVAILAVVSILMVAAASMRQNKRFDTWHFVTFSITAILAICFILIGVVPELAEDWKRNQQSDSPCLVRGP